MKKHNVRAIVLAAGKSSRFNRSVSKLLTPLCGRPLIYYPLQALAELGIPTTLVLGHQADAIKHAVADLGFSEVDFVIQEQQLGTGHAVASAREKFDRDYILILNGDHPLLTAELLGTMVDEHIDSGAVVSVLTAQTDNPFGYGRVVRENGTTRIVEEKECTPEQKKVQLINTGMYMVATSFLQDNINKIEKSSLTGEFYLTELIEAASRLGLPVGTPTTPFGPVRGINTLEELWELEQSKRAQLARSWMTKGVRFAYPPSTIIDIDVQIGKDSFIGAGAMITQGSVIGAGCTIGASAVIEAATLGDNVTVNPSSVINASTVGSNCTVGPFAHIRAQSVIENNVAIGNFVEIKNSNVGRETFIKHLSYLGDAQVGKSVNIGAGTITCNFNGTYHSATVIEDDAYVGTNNSLVAPLRIGKGAYTAAGSTITHDVPAEDLAVGRTRQINKTGYARVLREKYQLQQRQNEVAAVKAAETTQDEDTLALGAHTSSIPTEKAA